MTVDRERSGRGFIQYKPDERCTYGTEIRVYESSSAERDCVWLNLKESQGLGLGQASAHMDAGQVRRLIARLEAWLEDRDD